jgi:hypothetical protein
MAHPHRPKSPKPHQGGNNAFLKPRIVRWRISLRKLEAVKYAPELKVFKCAPELKNIHTHCVKELVIEDKRLVK